MTARPVFEGDVLVDLQADEKLRAKDLIADLMIATNTATARFLVEKGFPSVRRFLEVTAPAGPDRGAGREPRDGAADGPGCRGPAHLPERAASSGPAGFADLSLRIVKMLGPGAYVAAHPDGKELGHFGLAVSNYGLTAPNRRYPDLVTQRW